MRRTDRLLAGQDTKWWQRGGLLVAFVALLLTMTGVGAASAATLVADNFEDGDAAGWTTTGGTWIVAWDDSRVLRQSSLAADALARTGQPGWQNYTVTAKVEPTSFNGLPGFAGVVARAQSTTTYYALVLRPDDSAALIRTVGGTSATLAVLKVDVNAGTAYTLALRVSGRTLTGWVNGAGFSASDGFILGGPAGLATKWTTASFDNVTVTN